MTKTRNQDILRTLVESTLPASPLLDEVRYFHISVKQKVWSLRYLHGQIADLRSYPQYGPQASQSGISKDDIQYFGLLANLHFDCFLMNGMASLDTLAHEIALLYKFQKALPDRVYIRTIKGFLVRDHSPRALTAYLSAELAKDWFVTFSSYRNCTTHESLILDRITYQASATEGDIQEPSVSLPDDPKTRPFKYKKGRELKSYCGATMKSLDNMISASYYHMAKDIRGAKGALPIA